MARPVEGVRKDFAVPLVWPPPKRSDEGWAEGQPVPDASEPDHSRVAR